MRTKILHSINLIRRGSGVNLNLFRYTAMIVVLMLGIGNAWASHSNHTGKVTLVNATGNGTVYLSTSNTENTGQNSSNNPGAKNGTSIVTWSCGSSSSGDSKTLYPRGTGNAGYYYLGYATTNNATSGYSTDAKSFDAQSDTDTKIYGYFAEITINNGTASPATIAAEDNSATSTANTCTVTYATKGDNANDVKAPTVGGATGHGTFTAALGSVTSAGAATVNVTFKGDGTYGGNVAAGSRSRTSSAVVTLTSAVGNNKGTCTVTASFPNIIIGDGSFDHMTTINTVPKSATATFPVQWADDVEDFSASFGSVTGGGAWTVDDVTYTATDARSGTISIDYTFNPQSAIGNHSAVLTLAANANAGGASKTLTLTAESEKLADNDASIGETEYKTLAEAITAANGMSTNPTVKILRNVEGLTSALEIKKPMTIDLNSFTVSGTLTSSVNKLFYLNTATAVLTINDSRNGGKISATGDNNAILYTVLVDKGSLVLTKGDIEMNNTNTGGTAKANAVRIKAGARFAMAGGNLTATTAGSYAYGLFVTTNPSETNMIAVSGGTITATAAQTLGIGVYCQSSSATPAADPNNANVILDGVTVNASTTGTTDAYAVQTDAGVILGINSGTYNATVKTTTARAILTKGYTAIVNGSFNATAGTTDANAIRVEAGIAAVRNGAFSATTVQRIAHAGYVAANAKLLTYGGTFHGKSTTIIANGWATGTQVVSGGTLEAQGGTFIGEVANDGLTAAQTSYAAGIYANTGSNVTLANATLRGLTDNTYVNGAYALYTSTVNPVSLTNCTLEATSTDQYAYGVRLEGGATPLTMNNCTVNATVATLYAYGFYQNNATSTIDVTGSTFNVTSNGTRAYGIYVNAGTSFSATDCDFTVRTLQTSATAAAGSYLRGIFVAAGKTANLTGCTFNVSGHATYSTDAYGLYISGSVNVENTDVTVSSVKSGYAILNDGNTAAINIFSGKFSATTAESNATAAAAKQQLYGGYYVHNTNLAKYLPEGYMIETLTAGAEFSAGYKYHVRPETVVNDPVCKIGSTGYATLEEALDFVNKNSDKAYTIYMVKNYTLPAGNYTLPAKATLLVPYKDGQTTAIGTSASLNATATTRSAYKTLTFAPNAKMTVYGTIEASAQQHETNQQLSGKVAGPYGYIVLNEGANITLEAGAVLVAWGYISGTGTINAKNGSKAYEMIQLGWYKGGNTTLKINDNKSTYHVFVVTDYAYQNIECPITYYPGAAALGSASTDYFSPNDVELVGTTATSMFKMVVEEASADTWVKKEYDPTTDYTNWTMNNGAAVSGIKMESYSTDNCYLPITSNFRIILNYGEMEIKKDIEFLPGSELVIKKEAVGKVNSGVKAVFYDGTDWCTGLTGTGGSSIDSKYYYPVDYSPSWKAATGKTTNPRVALYKEHSASTAPNYLPDASLNVQGRLEISGSLYTTGDGVAAPGTAGRNAFIYSSNEDAGKIVNMSSSSAISTSTVTLYKCTHMYGLSSGKGITAMLAGGNSTAYPAYIQNGDGTYETIGGTPANGTWIYKNDQWVMVATEGCFSVEQINSVKHYYAYPAGFVEVTSKDADATTHLYTDAETGNRRFLVEGDCTWWEVEPTPYDGNKYKCVTPDHNGKYKYYEYISGAWQEATVTVTWSINGSNTNYTVLYGTHPKYLSASPTKASTTTDYYTWLGWTKGSENGEFFAKDAELPVATENTTYYAYFKADKFTFRATFNNYDGSLLETKLVAAGETPVYEGETPVKPASTSKEYTFTGWNPALAAISNAPVTYTAQFSEKTREYTITWANYDGTVLKTEKVASGTKPSAPTVTPTRPNDNYYTYTFDAWSPAISAVDGDQTYTATYNYEKQVPKYTATFKNGSKTVYAPSLKSGEVPVFDGTIPTKTADAQYTYTFDGWSTTNGGALAYAKDAALPALTADVTYYAHFATATNNYRIIWKSENGKVTLETDPTVPYGTTPSFDGATPTKDRVGKTGYEFDGWSASIGGDKLALLPNVTEDKVFYAHFLEGTYYNITFNAKEHGTAPAGYEAIGGSKLNAPEEPTETGYTFGGWYKESACTNAWNFASDEVNSNTTLYAKWTPNTNTAYTVEHYWQNIADNEYTKHETVNMTGTTDAATAAAAKSYDGFDSALPFSQGTIAPNGSTVVKIYYNRKTYLIKWEVKLNGEQEVYKEETLRYGAMPSYGADPTKEQSVSQVYAFSGWTPTPYAVNKAETYSGSFYVSPRPYTITFVNDNGVELWHSDFGYGSNPSYGGSTPVSSHTDDGYAYEHTGWKPAVAAVTGTATYTAVYSRSADAIVVNKPETVVNNSTAPTTTVEDHGTLTIGDAENDVTLHTNVTVVENGGELVVTNGSSISEKDPAEESIIIVESGGQLNVETGGIVEADVFIIQATTEDQKVTPGAHEEVQVSGELSETGSKNLREIYYDLTRKGGTEPFLARVWYAVAVPWAVDVPNYSNGGVFIKRGEDYVPQRLGATFDLLSYDGECRAQNGAGANCWVYLEDEIIDAENKRVMVPGKLYMIYLTEETYTIRFKKKAGEAIHTNTLRVRAYGDSGNDANWNGIANPATYKAYMNVSVQGLVQKFVPGTQPRDGGRYLITTLNDKQAVGQPFFVQVNPEGDTSVVVTRTNASAAPRRAQAEDGQEARYAIGIAANGKLADRLYIQTEEEKEDKYVIGKDMSKMSVSSYVAQMWVERYGSKLCQNTMALTRDKAVYPLGIYAPQAGEYMIFAPTDMASGDNIYLTYDGRVIWNLTMAPYYASLEKGTTTHYGLRLVHSNAPAVVTDVDEVHSDNMQQCTKVIMDDHVYILRGEELYTITGQKAQ